MRIGAKVPIRLMNRFCWDRIHEECGSFRSTGAAGEDVCQYQRKEHHIQERALAERMMVSPERMRSFARIAARLPVATGSAQAIPGRQLERSAGQRHVDRRPRTAAGEGAG